MHACAWAGTKTRLFVCFFSFLKCVFTYNSFYLLLLYHSLALSPSSLTIYWSLVLENAFGSKHLLNNMSILVFLNNDLWSNF